MTINVLQIMLDSPRIFTTVHSPLISNSFVFVMDINRAVTCSCWLKISSGPCVEIHQTSLRECNRSPPCLQWMIQPLGGNKVTSVFIRFGVINRSVCLFLAFKMFVLYCTILHGLLPYKSLRQGCAILEKASGKQFCHVCRCPSLKIIISYTYMHHVTQLRQTDNTSRIPLLYCFIISS